MSLILFAQKNPPVKPEDALAGLGVLFFVMLCVYGLLIAITLTVEIWYLVATFKTLSAVSESNREMQPAMVFLCLVPMLQIFWVFWVVIKVGASLEHEYSDRGLSGDGDFGKTFGIIALVSMIVCLPVSWIMLPMYCMKLAKYRTELESGGKRRKSRNDDDDD